MNLVQAKRVADLLAERENIADWLATFDGSSENSEKDVAKYPWVGFGDDNHLRARASDDMAERNTGWQGNMVVERDRAVRMLQWAIADIDAELKALGVSAD